MLNIAYLKLGFNPQLFFLLKNYLIIWHYFSCSLVLVLHYSVADEDFLQRRVNAIIWKCLECLRNLSGIYVWIIWFLFRLYVKNRTKIAEIEKFSKDIYTHT